MPRYIAFLRAINVGGHVVKMDRLRALFEEMGFDEVSTFIASGNVIFESPETDEAKLERQVEAYLEKALGYAVGTYIRSTAELTRIAESTPFGEIDLAKPATIYVNFLGSEPSKEAREKLRALRTETDDFEVEGREMYWLCRTLMSESTITGPMIAKALGMPGTSRNMTTVRKMAAKYGKAG
jgi:uncharacterized protein (DUF1697 family)